MTARRLLTSRRFGTGAMSCKDVVGMTKRHVKVVVRRDPDDRSLPGWVEELRVLAARTGMKEFEARSLRRES